MNHFIPHKNLLIFLGLIFFCFWGTIQAQTKLYEDFGPVIYSNGTVNGAALGMYAPIGFAGTTGAFSISTTNVPVGETQTLQGAIDFTSVFVPPLGGAFYQIEVASQYAPGGQNGVGTVEPFDASSYVTGNGALSIELYSNISTTFDFFIGDPANTIPAGPAPNKETQYLTPETIPAGVWTDFILPLDTNPGHWDSNFNTITWTQVTQIFIVVQGPPCLTPFVGGHFDETINYGTIQFIQNPVGPTATPVNTPNYCSTSTFTPTPTQTLSVTPTVTLSPTQTYSPTVTNTPVNTATPTFSPTPLPPLHVWPNPFNPNYAVAVNGVGPALRAFALPSGSNMRIFTISGELVNELKETVPNEIDWPGTNSKGNMVSTGTYYYVIQDGSNKTLLTGKVLVIMSK